RLPLSARTTTLHHLATLYRHVACSFGLRPITLRTMLVFRPITLEDLPQLGELAAGAGIGLTTLPKDPQLLENRIQESRRSFERLAVSSKAAGAGKAESSERPGGEIYLFVLEDLHTGKIVGTSAIVSKVGGFEPFYAYKI